MPILELQWIDSGYCTIALVYTHDPKNGLTLRSISVPGKLPRGLLVLDPVRF
jgi:hypothetical protein